MPVDICLVVPPFAQVETPSLGVAILAAACRARGLSVQVLHANILLAARTGHEAYRAVANSNFASLAGEHLFRPHAYPSDIAVQEPVRPDGPSPRENATSPVAPHVAAVIDDTVARILALNPRIIGLTSAYQQIMAASAIAWRVKDTAPHILTVLGGPNAASPMGEALAEVMPWFDHVFSGEADVAFADFCGQMLSGSKLPPPRIITCGPLTDMANIPVPDFEDYFADLATAQADGALPETLPHALPMETSRGCWWGAKNHCTFCGLNGATMAFREMPAARALHDIETLETRWRTSRFALADNIMPRRYLTDLLPQLAAQGKDREIFYEVKANLSANDLALMARAGVTTIQPGIESLSTPVLRLMRKGVSAHQNLSLLRDCRSLGITVVWNYLFGFPGEEAAHYETLETLVPAIEHLQPPLAFSPLIIDRFSPYFDRPDDYGIGAITPIKAYDGLFPADARLEDIAYHFRGTYSTGLTRNRTIRVAAARAIGAWRLQWIVGEPPILSISQTAEGPVLTDTRRIAAQRHMALPAEWDDALRVLERPHRRGDIPVAGAVVDALLEHRLVIEHEGHVLSIVTRDAERDGERDGEALRLSGGARKTGLATPAH